ncbi:putative lyase [compost metagenome]
MIELDEVKVNEILSQKGFKIIREYANKISQNNIEKDCFELAMNLYNNEDYRINELGIFILCNIANAYPKALEFLKNEVSQNTNWEIQEILAMAFDTYCQKNGYEESLGEIEKWLSNENPNTRRAVTEGLRIWTSRPYFKDNPKIAIDIISNLKNDSSEYVRKSVGNSLKDISKKYPELIKEELAKWDLKSKEENQVYKYAIKKL